jgi:hypothetical protein
LLRFVEKKGHVRAAQHVRRTTTQELPVVKAFITGNAQGVTDAAERVTAIMKDRPDPYAKRQADKAAQKDPRSRPEVGTRNNGSR